MGPVTVIDFAAAFGKDGDEANFKKQVDDFAKTPVKFDDTPDGTAGSRIKVKIKVNGLHVVKTVTKTCKLEDGTTKVLQPRVLKATMKL